MKQILTQIGLTLAAKVFNWAAEKAFDIIDSDNDGSISQQEFKFRITDVAKTVDSKSRKLYKKIKK
jgi:Ca2+-binding EF-hand superfamily protein